MTNSRQVKYLPLSELAENPKNPKNHELQTVGESISRFGMIDPIVRDERTGFLIAGHGRKNSLEALRNNGETPPEGVQVTEDGEWLVPVLTGWGSRSDTEANAALIALNRTTEIGGWDDQALEELLEELAEVEDGLQGVGYDDEELESLQHRLDELEYESDRKNEYKEGAGLESVKREMPLDLIFSTSAASSSIALVGYSMGWHPGVITSAANAARLYCERFPRGKRIMFMDNEWHGYDHQQHIEALEEFHPKYATVRDLVTRQQAKEFGVEYYTIDETLRMAKDVAAHCENVILIPKFDCLDKLPREIDGKRVVIGYSVESSYGGTTLPPSALKGWPVHLLGGPWKKQRAILNVLKDDVVSLDNNNLMMTSRFGVVDMQDGSTEGVSELLGYSLDKNHLMVSCVLSLANILNEVVQMYETDIDSVADEEIETIAGQTAERD